MSTAEKASTLLQNERPCVSTAAQGRTSMSLGALHVSNVVGTPALFRVPSSSSVSLRCLDMLSFGKEDTRRKLEMHSFQSRYQCPRCRLRFHDTVPHPDQEPLHVTLGFPGQYPVLHNNFNCLVVLLHNRTSLTNERFPFIFSFQVQRKMLATNGHRHGIPELWCVLKLPTASCPGDTGVSSGVPRGFTGWDWATWVQTLVFTLANFYKNLGKVW